MPETVVYSSTTTVEQHVVIVTNPVKAVKDLQKMLLTFLTVLCKSEKWDQLTKWSGAQDRLSIVGLKHNTPHFSHKSGELINFLCDIKECVLFRGLGGRMRQKKRLVRSVKFQALIRNRVMKFILWDFGINTVNTPINICTSRIGAGVLRKGEGSSPALACIL